MPTVAPSAASATANSIPVNGEPVVWNPSGTALANSTIPVGFRGKVIEVQAWSFVRDCVNAPSVARVPTQIQMPAEPDDAQGFTFARDCVTVPSQARTVIHKKMPYGAVDDSPLGAF